jgi:hypothetical protein
MAKMDSNDAGAQLANAAAQGDGIRAARILEEVGSCRWRAVINGANEAEGPHPLFDYPVPLLGNSHLATASTLNGDKESISVFKVGPESNAGGRSVLPLVTITDTRCKKKE